jgi:hypothetical protein
MNFYRPLLYSKIAREISGFEDIEKMIENYNIQLENHYGIQEIGGKDKFIKYIASSQYLAPHGFWKYIVAFLVAEYLNGIQRKESILSKNYSELISIINDNMESIILHINETMIELLG